MKRFLIAACLIALTLPSLSANDQRARVLLQAAEAKATVEGDLNAAIKLYKDAEKEAGSNRTLVAQALVKMADAYRALGDAEAQKIYQRLVRDFSDQKDAFAVANARLAPAGNASAGATLKDVEGFNASGNVTADGRYATYVNWGTGNIAVRDLTLGTSREVTARKDYVVYDPVISRDGRFVAYQSFNACIERRSSPQSNGVLCVLAIEGEPATTAKTVLESADIREVAPMDWSPDGNSIAVVLRRQDGTAQIGIVKLTDRSLTILQSTDWRGSTRIFFSPDGRHVAFDLPVDDASDRLDIRVVAVDGSHGGTAVEGPSQNIVMGWTPDGTYLLFASDRTGSIGLWAQRVTNAKPEGNPRLVHAGLGGVLSLGVTKAGSLYLAVQSGNSDVEVITVDLAASKQISSAVRPITRYVGTNIMPEWSRDGKFLAYVSQRGFTGNGRGRIVGIRDSATGAVRELRPKLTYINQLNWAPDNSALITSGTDLKGRTGAFTIDTRTGEVALVAEGENPYPKWSPDGKRIFYRKRTEGLTTWTIVERDLSSGAERHIVAGDYAIFSVSPDGQWLAAALEGMMGAAAQSIVMIRVATGETRVLLRGQPSERIPVWTGLPWTPDGQAVLMRKRAPNAEMWLVPTTGAPPRKIEADVKGWTFGPVGVISLHPDGRQIAGTRSREDRGAEVRVLENFLPALRK